MLGRVNRTLFKLAPLTNHISKHEYVTLPVLGFASLIASFALGRKLKTDFFSPMVPKPFAAILNNEEISLVGQDFSKLQLGDLQNVIRSINLPPINTELQADITKSRTDNLKKMTNRFQFNFQQATLYFRPVDYIQNETSRRLLFEFGVGHAFWILNAGPVDYLLDFIREGIRFEMIENLNESLAENRGFIPVGSFTPSVRDSSSVQLVEWIKSKTEREYDLNTYHCLHFCYEFGYEFIRRYQYFPALGNDPLQTNFDLLNWSRINIQEFQKFETYEQDVPQIMRTVRSLCDTDPTSGLARPMQVSGM